MALSHVSHVAKYFLSRLGTSVDEVYRIGSLAHGGFSEKYSDIDIAVILNSASPPEKMDEIISGAKGLNEELGKRLSVFWGNPSFVWGRLPVMDRLDILDHGVPLMHNCKANFARPDSNAIHSALLEHAGKGWKQQTNDLVKLSNLEQLNYKPYIRCVLYPARLIYSWDCLTINSNDVAVEYTRKVGPFGLDLNPIKLALECRYERSNPADIFLKGIDLQKQFEATMSFISK
ncbi:MAG: nucleotidyltransferase domain-containing protein [Nitrososphaerota archaeon]|jgi:predicted nucleotidyltransferase|nr:nucleotidyltransferase domain-containing protein [Nitrososphaerota archaeon]